MDEDDIRDFLVENPDYLQKNPELLGLLQIPHSTGAAVSLVERQVSVLRERNVDLRHRLRDLGAAAKENDQLFSDVRRLVLTLIPAADVASLESALLKMLRESFDVEYAGLLVFEESAASENAQRSVPESQFKGKFGALLARSGAGCGALRAEEFDFLFPGAKLVGSAAVATVSADGRDLGAIAVGSSDAAHYESNMGTLFLEFTADVVGLLLLRLSHS